MKAPLVATLICLCGAASAATCETGPRPDPAQAARPAEGLVLAAMAWQAPRDTPPAAPDPSEPRHDERRLLLAGLALMAAIALRRAGGTR